MYFLSKDLALLALPFGRVVWHQQQQEPSLRLWPQSVLLWLLQQDLLTSPEHSQVKLESQIGLANIEWETWGNDWEIWSNVFSIQTPGLVCKYLLPGFADIISSSNRSRLFDFDLNRFFFGFYDPVRWLDLNTMNNILLICKQSQAKLEWKLW